MTKGTQVVVAIAAILGALIAALSIYYFLVPRSRRCAFDKDRVAAAKDIFEDVVIKTLLPTFNTLIASILAWVFGKPIVESLAQRIRSSKAPV